MSKANDTSPQTSERHVILAVCQTTRDIFVHENAAEITLWADDRGPVEITYREVSHAD